MLLYAVLIFSFTLAAFGLLFRTLVRRTRSTCDPLDWLDDFSAAAYRPMGRLLDNHDSVFLASQPGFQPSIARRLRRQRIGIFHSYLREMIRDFHRLLQMARFMTVYATQDAADFEAALWRIRWSFYRSVIAIEASVALNILGLGAVDARRVLRSLERMQLYTLSLMPASEFQ